MTRDLYHTWLRMLFCSEDQRQLLIIDHDHPHISDEAKAIVRDECNADLVVSPGGFTSLVQLMNRSLNKSLTEYICAQWNDWMKEGGTLTAQGNLKQQICQVVINWVSRSWERLSPEIIVHSFLVCDISSTLDSMEGEQVNDQIPDPTPAAADVDGDGDEENGDNEGESGEDDKDVEEIDGRHDNYTCVQ